MFSDVAKIWRPLYPDSIGFTMNVCWSKERRSKLRHTLSTQRSCCYHIIVEVDGRRHWKGKRLTNVIWRPRFCLQTGNNCIAVCYYSDAPTTIGLATASMQLDCCWSLVEAGLTSAGRQSVGGALGGASVLVVDASSVTPEQRTVHNHSIRLHLSYIKEGPF